MRLSIVVPALDEEAAIAATLAPLQPLRREGHEVILADGGSGDATVERARPLVDRIVTAPRGRARQMNAGARQAGGEALVFLHADTRLPEGAVEAIGKALNGRRWGRFDVRLDSPHPLLQLVEHMMNLRSRLSGIATGDQALFVERALFEEIGGFPEIELMEDIAISRLLKRHGGRPACLRLRVVTSARRWHRNGILSTILLMWRLRLAYFLGADPARLARRYRHSR